MDILSILDNYLDHIYKKIKWRILYCRSYEYERKIWVQKIRE